MPTYDFERAFMRDYRKLTQAERLAFRRAVALFVQDLIRREFSPSLRVKRVGTHPGVWELTWAPDGRATFYRGDELRPGDPHIIWRRVGSHDIFRDP
jgi:hypothetical protein